MDRDFATVHSADVAWQDDVDVLKLGSGVQVKILFRDEENQHTDMLVKFPAGYVEPRHNHASSHSIVVLEGLQIAEGVPLRPGDYCWASGARPHGPFEYPEGCVVFVSFRGPSSEHVVED